MHTENLGWDLEASHGEDVLHLEVKGRSADSFTVELTPNEYHALKTDVSFRLCIVCKALLSPSVFVFKLASNGTEVRDDNGVILGINVREGAIVKHAPS